MSRGNKASVSLPKGVHPVVSRGRPTATNAVVAPIHLEAMPVILITEEERDVWIARCGILRSARLLVCLLARLVRLRVRNSTRACRHRFA